MMGFGAQYVVYEDSGFLVESVARVYPLMDKILFLVGLEPWRGTGDPELPRQTVRTIMGMPDPAGKFVLLIKRWRHEHEQRNEGLVVLNGLGCEWCMIVDDDEMFNRGQLMETLKTVSKDDRACAYLVSQRVYWKDRTTAIRDITLAVPTFVRTQPGTVSFTTGRCLEARNASWGVLHPDVLLCHHLSYIRTDDKMRRKLDHFTHADQRLSEWFEKVWLRWTPEMEDLHPNPEAPWSFKKAVPASSLPERLEDVPASLDTMLGLWDYSHARHPYPYGEDSTYRIAMEWMADCGTIEDWGCGTAYAKRFCKGRYVGVDGSGNPFTDVVADLREYKSWADGVLLRHVLEHNHDWRRVLSNAACSARKKLVIVVFTPFMDKTKIVASNWNGTPDICFRKEDLLGELQGFRVSEETLGTATQYRIEQVLKAEREA